MPQAVLEDFIDSQVTSIEGTFRRVDLLNVAKAEDVEVIDSSIPEETIVAFATRIRTGVSSSMRPESLELTILYSDGEWKFYNPYM